MNLFSLCLQMLLCSMFAKTVPSLPLGNLTDKDWQALFELVENVHKSSSLPNNEYYESFTLKPIIVPMTTKGNFNFKNNLKKILSEVPQQKNGIWTDIKSFLTDNANNFSKVIARDYNPIPSISKAIDHAKQSTTWVGISSFFTKNYDRLARLAGNAINDLKNKNILKVE